MQSGSLIVLLYSYIIGSRSGTSFNFLPLKIIPSGFFRKQHIWLVFGDHIHEHALPWEVPRGISRQRSNLSVIIPSTPIMNGEVVDSLKLENIVLQWTYTNHGWWTNHVNQNRIRTFEKSIWNYIFMVDIEKKQLYMLACCFVVMLSNFIGVTTPPTKMQ